MNLVSLPGVKRITSCVISVTERVSPKSEKWELTSTFEKSGDKSDMSFAEEDDIIDTIYGHVELTMTLCVCVYVCLCLHVCVCDDSTSVSVCLNMHV